MKLTRNRIKCLLCGDIVESTHRHAFQWCSCQACFVDGGLEYVRYGGNMDHIDILHEYEEESQSEIGSEEEQEDAEETNGSG